MEMLNPLSLLRRRLCVPRPRRRPRRSRDLRHPRGGLRGGRGVQPEARPRAQWRAVHLRLLGHQLHDGEGVPRAEGRHDCSAVFGAQDGRLSQPRVQGPHQAPLHARAPQHALGLMSGRPSLGEVPPRLLGSS